LISMPQCCFILIKTRSFLKHKTKGLHRRSQVSLTQWLMLSEPRLFVSVARAVCCSVVPEHSFSFACFPDVVSSTSPRPRPARLPLPLSLSLLPAAAASQALTASARDSRLEVQERSIHQKRERAGKEGKAGARERERESKRGSERER